jgi:hypothetical protein
MSKTAVPAIYFEAPEDKQDCNEHTCGRRLPCPELRELFILYQLRHHRAKNDLEFARHFHVTGRHMSDVTAVRKIHPGQPL